MKSIDYYLFEIEDFVADDFFIEWCLNPNVELDRFWNSWIQDNPTKQDNIKKGKTIVKDLYSAQRTDVNIKMRKEIWGKLEQNINQKQSVKIIPIIRKLVAVAAVFILGVFVVQCYQYSTEQRQEQWVDYINDSDEQLTISLSDDSKITLEPLTSIRYPKIFGDEKREVILRGKAFFDVSRDENKPFLIYANETITKVLGTHFSVNTFDGKDVEVEVISGKVAVYAQTKINSLSTDESKSVIFQNSRISIPKPNKKITLIPNQRAVFAMEEKTLVKSIVTEPILVKSLTELSEFNFKNESVSKVFEIIEEAYGINILFDKSKLQSCTISTELGDIPLMSKLEMICLALNLEMTESNAVINITGTGCS